MTNAEHPQLAIADALAWPVGLALVLLLVPRAGVVGPSLVAACAVWALIRVRRAAGGGRQPYRLTTPWVLRWSLYFVVFAIVMSFAVKFGRA